MIWFSHLCCSLTHTVHYKLKYTSNIISQIFKITSAKRLWNVRAKNISSYKINPKPPKFLLHGVRGFKSSKNINCMHKCLLMCIKSWDWGAVAQQALLLCKRAAHLRPRGLTFPIYKANMLNFLAARRALYSQGADSRTEFLRGLVMLCLWPRPWKNGTVISSQSGPGVK